MTSRGVVAIALGLVAPLACAGAKRHLNEPESRREPPSRFILEQVTRARWMNGGQRPELTPFSQARSALDLEVPALEPRRAERTIRVQAANASGDSASLTVRPDGRVVRRTVWFRPLAQGMRVFRADSAGIMRSRLREGGHLQLPEARTWDIVPRVHPRRFARGERWTDTLALATEYEGSRQTLSGVRMSVLIGDTTVGGRELWIVRDSAAVRYAERELQVERTLDTLVAVDRTTSGVITGRYLFDRRLGLSAVRTDTTSLTGDAVLQYPDGRSFRTPTRYERVRQWALYEPDAYATRQAERRAEAVRTSGGMVRVPQSEIQRRLASGDASLRDSLLAVWARETDPDRRTELYRQISLWARGGPAVRDSLDARRIAAGDTAFYVEWLARRAFPAQPPIDRAAAQEMIRVMSDPAIPFSVGGSPDALYENLVQTFATWPPAVRAGSPRCLPDACDLLADQWRTAQEPRLRDVGLAVLATTDPARWADTVLARAAAGSKVLQRVADLVNGVGATWPAAARLPLPGPDADWRAWLAWSSATSLEYKLVLSPTLGGKRDQLRFEDSHATAIRFYQARTGRDVIGEIRRNLAAATDDSARLVYGTFLTGLGDAPDVGQIAARFRSGSAEQIALAERQVYALFGRGAPLADSTTTMAILDRLIAAAVDTVAPWPALTMLGRSVARPTVATYVLVDSIPAVLRARWRDRVRFLTSAEWQRMPEREAATMLILSSVERIGPFVRVRTEVSERLARRPNETPWLAHGGIGYYLLASGDGWVVAAQDMWTT